MLFYPSTPATYEAIVLLPIGIFATVLLYALREWPIVTMLLGVALFDAQVFLQH
jgi:hypothetical protein